MKATEMTPDAGNVRAARLRMLKDILPESVTNVHMAIVDMDITLLSIADILRNINRSFPKNTTSRNAIANGQMAVAVLCKTDLLKPLSGLIIVVTADDTQVKIKSKNYVVLAVSEQTISNADRIMDMLDRFTTYLIQNYGALVPSFEKFYTLFVYDAYEMEES